MKIILCPDSFKGTASSHDLCAAISDAAYRIFPECETVSLPAADGGEGSAECFALACGGSLVTSEVTGPFAGERLNASFAMLPDGSAVVETASCAGLPLVADRRDALNTTTFGVGELMLKAVGHGARRLTAALGGSCTTDAGAGCLSALGFRFYDRSGAQFIPCGGTLHKIHRIDASGLSNALDGVEITIMCDVDNPLYGPKGAAFVYSPQKGASPDEAVFLDDGLKIFADKVRECLGVDLSALAGGGAAGGLGAGLSLIPGVHMRPGIETFLDTVGFDRAASDADFAVTGEGMLDEQSLMGKAVAGIAGRCKRLGLPLYAIVGSSRDPRGIFEAGVTAVFTVNRMALPLEKSAPHTLDNVRITAENLFRAIRITTERKNNRQ